MTNEEFRQELLEDSRNELVHDYKMRDDYGYFIDHSGVDIEEFSKMYYKLQQMHKHFDWEFDIKEVLV